MLQKNAALMALDSFFRTLLKDKNALKNNTDINPSQINTLIKKITHNHTGVLYTKVICISWSKFPEANFHAGGSIHAALKRSKVLVRNATEYQKARMSSKTLFKVNIVENIILDKI